MRSQGISLWRTTVGGAFVLCMLALLWVRRPDPTQQLEVSSDVTVHQVSGEAFGTTYSIRWVSREVGPDAVRQWVLSAVDKVNRSMSTYQSDSELSRFNTRTSTAPVSVSEDLSAVLKEAKAMHQQTGHAFDPTVGPLVNVWGFGPEAVVKPPSVEALDAARSRVGFDRLVYAEADRTMAKRVSSLYVDLSAIAKGYAVDVVATRLREADVEHHLVEIGGEVRAHGQGPSGRWRVGIEKPQRGQHREIFEVVALDGQSMATSGNYRNFVTVDGSTVTHIIDPRSGEPVAHGLGSVTVVDATCMRADALATALYVLGAEEGVRWAEAHNVAALFLTVSGSAVDRRATTAFVELARRVASKAGE